MALSDFLTELRTLLKRANELKAQRPAGKPEENTKGSLLTPFIEALGYGPDERTFEGTIKTGTSEWVDYLLLPNKRRAPWLMLEAKSFWNQNLWNVNKDQVLRYMRDYSLMVAEDAPINWLVLTNFSEWYVLRLNDREPFWTFSADDLRDPEFAQQVYECFARENIPRDRLLSRFTEGQRDELGERFLSDLISLKSPDPARAPTKRACRSGGGGLYALGRSDRRGGLARRGAGVGGLGGGRGGA